MEAQTVVILVLGVATLIVTGVGLAVKLIELSRK